MKASRITTDLWAGPFAVIDNLVELKKAGVEVVVSVLPIGSQRCDATAQFIRRMVVARGLRHRVLVAADDDPSIPPEHIWHVLSDPAPTLIHCNSGQNRSTMLAACWLLLHAGWANPIAALGHVMDLRSKELGKPPNVWPEMRQTVGRFARWLEEFRG